MSEKHNPDSGQSGLPNDAGKMLRLYQQLVEAAGLVIYACDAEGFCTYVNAAVNHLFGYPPEAIVGHHFTEFIHPDWRMSVAAFYLKQFVERIPETTLEFPALTQTGEIRWVEQMVILLQEGRHVSGFHGFVRDISSHKALENQLRANEITLRSIIDHSIDLIFVKDRNMRYQMFNPAGVRLLGRPLEAILNKTDADLFTAEATQDTLEHDRQVLETGEPRTYEITRTIGGKQHWFLVSKFPFVSAHGERDGIVGIVHDITQRKQVEQSLRESEERYRAVVEDQSDLICRFLPDTTLTFVNEAYCRYFGLPREALIGQPFLKLVPPDTHDGVREKLAELAQNGVLNHEHTVISADGSHRWQEWTDRALYDSDGRIIEFQSVGRDITHRKQAEAERAEYTHRLEILQQVDMELSQLLKLDYVQEIALDAAVRLSNASAGAIHLIEKEGLRVAKVIGHYPPEQLGTLLPFNHGIIGRVAQTRQAELVLDVDQDPDYQPNVIESRAQITVPLILQDQLIGVLNVQTVAPQRFTPQLLDFLRLLAARIASALDNARLFEQVDELNQFKTQLIRVAAHDVRNPLGAITGYLQMLTWEMDDKLTDRARDQLRVIKQAADRIEKISKDILALERAQGMKNGFLSDSVDLRELATAACEEYRDAAAEKSLTFPLHLTDVPVMVWGDRAMLGETMSNLLSNALKYTPKGGYVQVRLAVADSRAIFKVEDTGFGVPEDQQARLFQPFFRAVTKETGPIKGTGLGLHLVKSIIEQHGGKMHFHSVYGQGSTFGFELPLYVAPVFDPDAPTEPSREMAQHTNQRSAGAG